LQEFLGRVLGQVQLIVAGVALRKPHQVVFRDALALDREVLHSTHALQILEALQWDLRAARDELQEEPDLARVHGRQGFPEPDNLRTIVREAIQHSVLFEVVHYIKIKKR
jgi:hypothetical protein